MFDNIFKKKYQKLYASICKVVYELSLQKLLYFVVSRSFCLLLLSHKITVLCRNISSSADCLHRVLKKFDGQF